MKRVLLVLLGCGLAASWIGCRGDAESTVPDPADSGNTAASATGDMTTSEYTLVSLKVPNMT
jgi:hypothetical protein